MAALARRQIAIIVGAVLALALVAGAFALAVMRFAPSPTAGPSASASVSPSVSQSATPTSTATPSAPGSPPTGTVPGPQPSEPAAPAPPQPEPEQPAPPAPEPQPQAPVLPEALRGLDVERIATSQKLVALTFDAGANDAGLASILSTLAANQVPATFFLTGRWAQANPAKVAQIAAAGHRIGNHSMTHTDMTTQTDAQIAAELANAQAAIQAGGSDPRPLFRFPSGARNARTIAAVNANGYAAIRWTVDSLGWQGTLGGARGPGFVTQRVLAALQPGEIVLMHVGSNPDDGSTLDAAALPDIIAQMRAAGYGFTTLDILL
ncbi:polysaccharide deacetylase family protein [Sinomonas sp. ASV486]|uniref:polysaccharide deacetylase family protein n=1 Tax=Sinomonas sp. ASV486 TaxID=3051170 RepID=UPI0027DB6B8F|nr:polysaccharide deacetylase family protein [Sinomonas sp. ASV486]MDQ4488818.1 polysaccharide deacetylase family protein [Sinomonas sp. ASV486]